ncbi:Translation factor guf1 mitochondrial [Mucor velutinosus]|uniref:Translation factor guf1 mitochondrial n=1 Tax=Mucor velutinosus TaxID=708070 RepID=A0AAN7DT69_9FUNG|nr:Translation factor guf1 mitochondrial [Mucor velutinosus]
MATPNNPPGQRPPMFRPGIPSPQQQQQPFKPMFNNRPPPPYLAQSPGNILAATGRPPPPFVNQQPAVRPGFSPYRPPAQPIAQPSPPQQQQQVQPQPMYPSQQSPLPPQSVSPQHSNQMSTESPSIGNAAPLEAQMSNMQIHSRPSGRAKRVYAQVPSIPVSNTQQNLPAPPQQQQQLQYQQPQPQNALPQPMGQQQPMGQLPQQPLQQPQQQQRAVNTPLGLPHRSGAKPRIDPNQIPSPVQIQTKDMAKYETPDAYYGTCDLQEPLPLASTHFRSLDQGNCNPHFMRSTLQTVPATADLMRDTGLPFGLVLQPLAQLHPDDTALLVVPLAARCSRCKAYINPWCKFTQGGQKFVCNLCEYENTVAPEDVCPCDISGRRMDAEQRPEFMLGSIEYDAPEEYWQDIEPKPLHWLVAIDVSRRAMERPVLGTLVQILKHMLASGFPPSIKIGIMTFDTSVHFWNLKGEQATMMVVSDIDDVFVPMSAQDMFVDPTESRAAIESLLEQLPALFHNEHNLMPHAVFASAVQAAALALKTTGGKVTVFQSSLPSLGPGVLKNRDDPKIYGQEREKGLFQPQDTFYTQLGASCVQAGVSIDLWLIPALSTPYMDVATIGVLSALTGGDTHYLPDFDAQLHSVQFMHDFKHAIYREQGYRAALRVRCSNGLSVEDHYGNFNMSNATDLELANINADTTVGVALKHDGKLPENKPVYFQCALLYTTAQGQRRVRVHNLSLNVGVTANPVFKLADLDTSLNFIIKRNITLTAKKSLTDLSYDMDQLAVKILTSYRKYCASGASAAQLILPESYKNLPLLFSSMKKSAIMRKDPTLNVDTRVYFFRKIKALSISGTIQFLYPKCVKLHTWFEEQGPLPLERLSYDRFDPAGIYWVQSHSALFVWIGANASPQLVEGMFGTSNRNEINPLMEQLPVIENSTINNQLRQIYYASTNDIPYLPRLQVIRHGMDLEVELSKVLVEDETFNQMSYVDYLCMIHKQIQTELEREKQDTVISSASYWAHRY